MSNPELAKFYLGLPIAQGKMTTPTADTLFASLEEYSKGQWSWEVTNEFLVMDNTTVCTNVALYIPGRVLSGRSTCAVKDVATNHIRALMDAAKLIMSNTTQGATTPQAPTPPQNVYQNMTVDQIQSALNANAQQPQVPQAQSQQVKDDGLPFYMGPNDPQAPPDVKAQYAAQQGAQQAPQTPPPPQGGSQYPPDYDVPQERYKGFSQHQMDRMADFKRRAEIVDDEALRNYIHMWNPNYCSKIHLTPQNVDEFFDWYDRLEATRC